MSVPRSRLKASIGPSWVMALLAPALIVGIVFMHSLLLEPSSASAHQSHARTASTVTQAARAHPSDAADQAHASDSAGRGATDPMGQGNEGGMSDCSGLMAICLALLVSFAALIGRPRGASRWVLWLRPPPSLIRLGTLRVAFADMTPRQRTTVIRC
jgi:hypothetical protein